MNLKDELKDNALRFYSSANLVYSNMTDFTSATSLYFKSLFSYYDFKLFDKLNTALKNHTERFQFLKLYFKNLYEEIDPIFEIYRSTYTTKISKERCEYAKKIAEKHIKELQ